MTFPCSPSKSTIGSKECRRDTSRPAAPEPAWQRRFLELLPKIRRHAQIRFRDRTPETREDLVQETIARALLDYVRLVERGNEHVASASSLGRFATLQVSKGCRVGSRLNAHDVSSEYCRSRNGVLLQSLDGHDENAGGWHESMVEDRRSTPADIAAFRVDFAQWLKTLPKRSRRLAERLAIGETTSGAARLFGISSGRVSQLRRDLRRAWYAFQGEAIPAEM